MRKFPPRCPCCSKLLTKVFENDYKTYVFEPKSGAYKEDDIAGYLKMYCPYCDADLRDIFEEGVYNYGL